MARVLLLRVREFQGDESFELLPDIISATFKAKNYF